MHFKYTIETHTVGIWSWGLAILAPDGNGRRPPTTLVYSESLPRSYSKWESSE